MNSTILEQIKGSIAYFSTAGTKEVYEAIYKTKQYPFFFLIQSIWCCYFVKKSFILSEKPKTSNDKKIIRLILQFLLAFVLVFSSREIVSIIAHKKSPIHSNPAQLFIFIILFALFNFTPYLIFYRIVDVFYYFIGLLQGFNQMRLFLHTVNYLNEQNLYQTHLTKYVLATIAIIFEYVIECSMRRIFRTAKTNVSNATTIIRTIIICSIYIICVTATQTKQYFVNDHLGDVLFAAALGISNSAVIL